MIYKKKIHVLTIISDKRFIVGAFFRKKTKISKPKDNEVAYLRHGFLFADLKSKTVLLRQIKKPELSLGIELSTIT